MSDDRRSAESATAPGGRNKPQASRLTARQLYRLIAPRRKWRAWAGALILGWPLMVVLSRFVYWPYPSSFVILFVVPAVPPLLATTLASMWLTADRDGSRLESLALTCISYRSLLGAYHRRASVTAALFLAWLAPMWVLLGRAPHPLLFLRWMAYCQGCEQVLPTTLHSLSGLSCDLAAIYLGGALGIGCVVAFRDLAKAIPLGCASLLGFNALAWLIGYAMAYAINAAGLGWSQWNFSNGNINATLAAPIPREPGYTLLLWSFAILYSVAALILARVVLGLAARRLDRLVTD